MHVYAGFDYAAAQALLLKGMQVIKGFPGHPTADERVFLGELTLVLLQQLQVQCYSVCRHVCVHQLSRKARHACNIANTLLIGSPLPLPLCCHIMHLQYSHCRPEASLADAGDHAWQHA